MFKIMAYTAGSLWTIPNTLLGIILGLLGLRVPICSHGALNIDTRGCWIGTLTREMGISAFTLGDCVIYAVVPTPRLRIHEGRHVRQYHLLGPLFLPVYFALMAVYGYHNHPLERDARQHEDVNA